jgi:hypothetical protein
VPNFRAAQIRLTQGLASTMHRTEIARPIYLYGKLQNDTRQMRTKKALLAAVHSNVGSSVAHTEANEPSLRRLEGVRANASDMRCVNYLQPARTLLAQHARRRASWARVGGCSHGP